MDRLLGMAVAAPLSWAVFLRYFRWTLEGMVISLKTTLITIALAGNLAMSLAREWRSFGERWRGSYSLLFASFLFIPATIAIGIVWAINPSPMAARHPNALAVWTNNAIFIGAAIWGGYWTYRMKGLRWFALAITLVALWFLFWAGFFAGMSLTGDWL